MNNDSIPMRTCTKCGKEYPETVEFFRVGKNNIGGLERQCRTCRDEYFKRHYKQNRETIIEYQREYRKNNYDKRIESSRKYQRTHPDKVKESTSRWQKNNPEKGRLKTMRYATRKKKLPNTFTEQQWLDCLEYFNCCCAVCGNQLRDLFGNVVPHADHWIPITYKRSDNPGTVAENIVCLCNSCNQSKQAKLPTDWLKQEYGTRQANIILARIETYFQFVRDNTDKERP